MVQIFESFDDKFNLSNDAYEFINQNPMGAIEQIDFFFTSINTSFTEKEIDYIFELYNSIIQKEVQRHLIEKAYQFFVNKVIILLELEMYFSINTLLDLFWHNWLEINWSNTNRNISFLKNTYPILFCKDEFAEIAARFYWDLISNNKNFNDENIRLQNEFREKNLDRYNWLFPFGE